MLYSGLLSLTKILFLIECDSKHTIKSTKSIKVEGDSKDPNYISFLISTIKSANRCNERFIEFQTGVIKLHCCIIIKFKYTCRDYCWYKIKYLYRIYIFGLLEHNFIDEEC